MIWSRAKGGRKEEADLGVAEWRIPVWRVEREENRRERGRHRATDEHAGEVRKEHAVRDRGDERREETMCYTKREWKNSFVQNNHIRWWWC